MLGANSLRPYRKSYCENNTAYESDEHSAKAIEKQLKLERLYLSEQYKFVKLIDNGVNMPAV